MPEYIIRIIRQVEVLQKIDERVVTKPSEAAAKREASYILAEEYAGKPDVTTETIEKPEGTMKDGSTCPF